MRGWSVTQGGQPITQEQQAEQAAEREEADMQRQGMLAAIMQPSARERCAFSLSAHRTRQMCVLCPLSGPAKG